MQKSNKRAKINNRSNQIWVLFSGVVSSTFYISTTSEDPFNTPKFIILMLTAGWLLGHLIYEYYRSGLKRKSVDFKFLLIVIFFLLSQTLALAFTHVKFTGLFGDTQRKNGYLTYLSLSIIVLYSAKFLKYLDAIKVIQITVFSGCALAIYGTIQTLGYDFFKWENPYNSIIGTLGNPNFASALLAIFSSFASLSYFIKNLGVAVRILALPTVALCLFAIIRSESRQGLVTFLFIHLFFVSTFYLYKNQKIGIALTLVSAGTVILSIAGMLQRGPLSGILYKESVSVRGFYWRAAYEMFRDKPLTGVGLDNYGGAFKAFRELDYPLRYGYTLTSSSAHNTTLQMFATGGLLLGVSYLAILFFIFKSSIKLIKSIESEKKVLVILFTSVWVGFQAQSFISIDNIGLTIWGWLIGGVLIALARENVENSLANKSDSQIQSKSNSMSLVRPALSIIFVIPILVVAVFLNRAERDTFITRTIIPNESNSLIAKNYAQKVIDNPLAEPFYKFKVGLTLFDFGFTKESLTLLDQLLEQDPTNLIYLNAKAYYQEGYNDIPGSIKTREMIEDNDPWNADNYFVLGLLHVKSGNSERATYYKSKVLAIADNTEIGTRAKNELP
ncbi:O-Antigen ligase-like protein [Candidatus Nanopelagicus hibericus]|uniref:O-Antigen ligase-like protein n=1 Tax=Candidatus Nanopelagicus hibericus TaxID=1884915 RepID=A0A249KAG3_9ACTN|nr:O-antigen ligase family protein [Candidatus Nanopelagicus hibericus]ASY13793.1 O-Antigen ligase-like protein [Candidatus Nanopelagicus hibericus]